MRSNFSIIPRGKQTNRYKVEKNSPIQMIYGRYRQPTLKEAPDYPHAPTRKAPIRSLSGPYWEHGGSAVPCSQHQPLSERLGRLDTFREVFWVWGFINSNK